MQLYQLKAKQVFPISKATAWDFISNPKNLAKITPGHMGFDILSGAEEPIFPGQIITYNLKPFPFIPTKWVTEITQVKDGEYFVDEQLFGPYSLWHHKHFLKEVEGGVEMHDVIDYRMPFGYIGRFAHMILVKRQLQTIFNFRKAKMAELFGKVDDQACKLEIIPIK